MIDGDDNRNAAVEGSYWKKGEGQWHTGMPLLRLPREESYQGDRMDVFSPNMFAGSILDLEPRIEYKAQFVNERSGWSEGARTHGCEWEDTS